MRCLVTGAAGFIGSQLAEALVERGDEVLGIDCFTDYYPRKVKLRNLSKLRKLRNFKLLESDLSSGNASKQVKSAEVVFHLAAQPGVRGSWGESFSQYSRNNVDATQKLLEACKGAKLNRFVYASSSSIYGDAEKIPTSEDAYPRPVSPYGVTKLTAEHLCDVYRKSFGVPTVILRYFTVYGPRQRPDMAFTRFIDSVRRNEPIEIYGDGNQGRDFTFVSDTVRATLLALEARPGSVYNVGTGRIHKMSEVVSHIGELLGRPAKVKRKSAVKGDAKTTCADTSKIRAELGFEPSVDIRAGLRMQVEAQLRGRP